MRTIVLPILLIASGCAHYANSELAIRKRAEGFKDKTLAQAARIDPTDGIDASEALAIAEWKIFGAVDLGDMRVLSYTQPSLQGEEWRIGVHVVAPQGAVDMPIYVDRITGYSHGKGWSNDLIDDTPIGRSRFRLDRRGEQLWLEVTLLQLTAVGDQEARAECMKDAKSALQIIRRGFGDMFQDVHEAEIKLTEYQVSDVRSDRDRRWHAEVLLRKRE